MKKRKKNPPPFPVNDVCHILYVLLSFVKEFIKEKQIETLTDEYGRHCISDADFKVLAYSEEAKKASLIALREDSDIRESDIRNELDIDLIKKTNEKIKEYRGLINILQKIHSKHKFKVDIFKVDIINDETALVASYLLFYKAINLLHMACACLEHSYFNAGVFLRLIDETIDIAEYFVISEGTSAGDKHLKAWFRENMAPSHATCRLENSKFMAQIDPEFSAENQKGLMDKLYNKKSKWIHPNFNSIRESLVTKPSISVVDFTGFDYDHCSNPRKIYELTLFFRSSIWSTFQGFYMSFVPNNFVDEADKRLLLEIDRHFGSEPDGL